MIKKNPYYLVIDLEASCCDKGSVPRDEMEIIEIGAVIVDGESLKPIDDLQIYIKPVRHPKLTEFCIDLTGITQDVVDNGVSFVEAIDKLNEWKVKYPGYLFCSWGNYDRKQFIQDCEFHNIEYPFGESNHVNLKKEFSKALNTKKMFGMAGALRKVGLQLHGRHHSGIDDARNIARLLPTIVES